MKYTTQTYTAEKSYTSYSGLKTGEIEAIANNNYDHIPNKISTPYGEIEIYNSLGDFAPYYDSQWKVSASGWATHVPTGIKVNRKTSATAYYYHPNGCGDLKITVTVKIPQL